MKIVITGIPGSGKSTVASLLSDKLQIELIGLKEFINENNLYTFEGKQKTVDIKKLERALLKELKDKKDYIVESHLACEFKIPADYVVVLRTNPKVLKQRLQQRRYRKKKLEENLMAEMLDYCSQKVDQVYRLEALELDTSREKPEASARRLIKAIKEKRKRLDKIDYSHELKVFLHLRK